MSGQSILFDIIARDKASSTFKRVGESAGKSESHLKKFAETAKVVAGVAGAAVVGGGLIEFFKSSVERGEQAQRVTALTAQVIKTTGGAAHATAAQVHELSTALSEKTGIDNQQIQSGANMLLTFKDIRNEAGKGNKIFNQATSIVTDMAAAMAAASGGQLDVKSTAIQVGKALNDPIKGLTALRRVGVAFTEQQQKQIKTLVEHGHKMQAQKIILRELKSEFGGAAASQATESDRARIAVKNLEEQVGNALLPTVDKLAKFVTDKAVPAISGFVKGMQDGTGAGGEFAGHLHDLYEAGKHVADFIGGLPGPVKKYGAELVIATAVVSKFGGAFTLSAAQAEAGVTRTQLAMDRLRGGLRNLAGAGGLMLLTKGMGEVDDSSKTMESTLGGALTGFAVGGPIGAAVGAIGGFAASVVTAGKTGAKAFDPAKKSAQEYADTLGVLNGKIRQNTLDTTVNSLAKNNDAAVRSANALGISTETLARSLMGNKKAQEKVNAAILTGTMTGKMMTYANGGQANAADVLTQSLKGTWTETALGIKHTEGLTSAFREAKTEAEAEAAKGRALAGALKGIPVKVQTKFVQPGSAQSLSNIETLVDKYRRTPKQVRTLVKTLGVSVTKQQMQVLIDHSRTLDSIKPTVRVHANTSQAVGKLNALKTLIDNTAQGKRMNIYAQTQGRATGGHVAAGHQSGRTAPHTTVQTFNFGDIYAANLNDLLQQAQMRSRRNALSGARP